MVRTPVIDQGLLAELVDDSADAIIVVGESGSIRYANRAVRDLLGFEPAELIGEPYSLLIPPDLRSVHERHHAHFMDDPVARPMGENLVLSARHRDGDDIDVAIALQPLPGPETLVAAFIREVSTTQRLIGRLAATNDVLTASLAGASLAEVEQLVVEVNCKLLNATTSWLLVRPPNGPLDVVAECGDVAPRQVVERLIERGLADALDAPTVIPGGDAPDAVPAVAQLLVAPVRSHSVDGVLVATRSSSLRPFLPVDEEVAHDFASATAITLELISANAQVDLLRSMAEHDRIARDLHDTVIQRLFAIAMRLESAVGGPQEAAGDRMSEAVDSLDDVIREIRSTIFDLRRPKEDGDGLRSAIASEIDRVADLLGFAPSLRIAGPIVAPVADGVAREAAAVVRELLANVVRHARASTVDVTIRIDDEAMTIVVEDDGVGMGESSDVGSGLSNLLSRARALGGSFAVVATSPHGVRAQWEVPLDSDG